jgi:hypothetical protein
MAIASKSLVGGWHMAQRRRDLDAVIAGLMTALSEGGNPESLLAPKNWVGDAVKGDAVKEAIEPLIKPLSEAVWTIYTNFRNDRAATRMSIRTQLEAAKWPHFDTLQAAQ